MREKTVTIYPNDPKRRKTLNLSDALIEWGGLLKKQYTSAVAALDCEEMRVAIGNALNFRPGWRPR
jgi:hypothetical protein